MDGSQQLLNEQARACICGKLGHSRRFVLPVQKRDGTRQVLTMCKTCGEETWIQLPSDGYERFLEDLTNGKIV